MKRIQRAKLFVFLHHHRHKLLNEAFQQEWAGVYRMSKRGQPPIAPAQLALATILQAYTGVSDDGVIKATLMDRRWPLVLDCWDTDQAPFSKGTLVAFDKRLIEGQLDRRLIERTIELASIPKRLDHEPYAPHSSPLWGAGRVEDSYHLIGHALKKRLGPAHYSLSGCTGNALYTWQRGSLSQGHLRSVSIESSMHNQCQRAQGQHPS